MTTARFRESSKLAANAFAPAMEAMVEQARAEVTMSYFDWALSAEEVADLHAGRVTADELRARRAAVLGMRELAHQAERNARIAAEEGVP